ncbi:MAG: sigma-54 dependent transcriptional regulator [Sedimenticolaceae bacterium]
MSESTRQSVLVVEDDSLLNRLISEQLVRMGYAVRSVKNWAETQALLERQSVNLIITDVQLPDANGVEMLPALTKDQPVIVLTAYGSVRDAVNAMKNGAAEYLLKPVHPDELELMVTRVLDSAAQHRDLQFCRRTLKKQTASGMVGLSHGLSEVENLIEAVAPTDMTVLVQGESGVGKELVAQAIHIGSNRSKRNFVAVDCCTLQEQLFESELFGHERGAFTGATGQKKGLIESADGGTLFLDEIGEIEPGIQAKLLRVLETGHFRRVGSNMDRVADVRVVAATNRDLEAMSQEGTFRSDLFYRLSAFIVEVPPLRERRDDIPALVEHFVSNHNFSRRISKKVNPEAMRNMVAYDWPGNIRELKNVVERAIILSRESSEIRPAHLGQCTSSTSHGRAINIAFDHEPTLEEIQQSYLTMVMQRHSGHRSQVAETLGISERNVYRLIEKYGLKD